MLTEWHDVDSSNVRSICFDTDTSEIIVVFRTGGVYAYKADDGLFREFLDADSKGQFVHQVLKARQLEYRRINVA